MTQRGRSGVVNALTFVRVPLIFAWAALAILCEVAVAPGSLLGVALASSACVAMFLSGITDLLDGRLARKWGVVSTFGKMADPLMDKVFYLCAFPTLIWQITRQAESPVHAVTILAFTVLYLLRDTWVTFLRSVGAKHGAEVAAMWLGKVRTALSFPGAGFIYAYLALHQMTGETWSRIWLGACFVAEAVLMALTVWSMLTYTKRYWPYLKKALDI